MHTDPITGARYPDSTDATNVPSDMQHLAADLSKVAGGIFTTNAARDAAFSNYVASGGTMVDGLTCRVAGDPQVYHSSGWRGIKPRLYGTTTADATTYTATHSVMTISVPDPGWQYAITCSGSALLAQLGPNVQVAAQCAINGTLFNPVGPSINGGGGGLTNQLASTWGSLVTDPMTGAATVTFQIVVQVSQAPTFGYQVSGTNSYNRLSVQVIPT